MATQPKLKWFKKSEFGIWWPMMNKNLLLKLDKLRELLDSPIHISPVAGGIGRHGGGDSQHNVLRWGEVRAIDVFPTIGGEYVTTETQRKIVFDAAKRAGFTGIGIYTDTQPGNLLHVDVRQDRTPENPALWSRVAGQYGGIAEVVGYV